MTPRELRAALADLGLSQVEASRILAIPRKTLSCWLAEPGVPAHRPIPAWMPRYLMVLQTIPGALAALKENAG